MICRKIKKNKAATGVALAGLISIAAFINHSPKEVELNTEAAKKVNEIVISECFEKELMASDMDSSQANGLSKQEIISLVRGSQVNLELEMYYSFVNTVGYTYEKVQKVWMNRKFHNRFTVCEKASNLFHETLHKLGFGHDIKATERRKRSVPYIGNQVIEKCCN